MRVLKIVTDDAETSSEIDLFGDLELTDEVKDSIRDQVGDYLLEQINKSLAHETSPIDGSKFPKLSPAYRAKKKLENNSTAADLELTGEMKDELTYKPTASGISLGVYGEAAPRADNHNKFSKSAQETDLPRRQFLPKEGEGFTSQIEDGVASIIQDAIAEATSIPGNAFNEVRSKKDLYSVLSTYFPDLSRTEMRSIVVRDERIYDLMDSEDVLQYL